MAALADIVGIEDALDVELVVRVPGSPQLADADVSIGGSDAHGFLVVGLDDQRLRGGGAQEAGCRGVGVAGDEPGHGFIPFSDELSQICWALASPAWTVAWRSWWETAPSCSAGCSSASSSSSACIAPLIRSIVSCRYVRCASTFRSSAWPVSNSCFSDSSRACSCWRMFSSLPI